MIRAVFLGIALLMLAPLANAHTRSQSMSHWTMDGDRVIGRVEADALDVTRLYALGGDAPLEEVFRREVDESFAVRTGAGVCTQSPATPAPAVGGRIAVTIAFRCPTGALAGGAIDLEGRLFVRVAATHLHFAVVTRADGAEAEAVLTDTHRTAHFELRPDAQPESSLSAFLRLLPVGAMHVWSGFDHLAFILGLVLLARRAMAIVVAASGFTLGHTATLVLASLGVVAPHAATVEALIGFTVAFVALEASTDGRSRLTSWSAPLAVALLMLAALAAAHLIAVGALALVGLAVFVFAYPRGFPRGEAAAPWLAAAFGLVHGCGFAGALGELDLPRPRLLAALAGFNVGVELAQAVVIGAALAAGLLWRRSGVRAPGALDFVCAGLLALGAYWFVSRALGGAA